MGGFRGVVRASWFGSDRFTGFRSSPMLLQCRLSSGLLRTGGEPWEGLAGGDLNGGAAFEL